MENKAKKEEFTTLAEVMDHVLLTGGNWEEILEKCNKFATDKKFKPVTKGVLKAHRKFRIEKQKKAAFETSVLTETGIEVTK